MEVEGATRRDISYLIEMKHVCKFCHKRFPCGRSLGGHMRSHLITIQSDHDPTNKEKVNTSMEKKKEKKNQQVSPSTTTTTTAGDFSGDANQIKCCKECGKAFHSSKALSGHMKSHAVEREKEKERQRQREKENSLLCDQVEKTPKQQVMDRESDNEAEEEEEEDAPKSNFRPRRANRRSRYMKATSATTNSSHNNNNGGSSSVSEIDQQEQENVAMCLIMLSRDVGPWGRVNYEISDTNSVFLEQKKVAEEAGENRSLKLFKWVGESSTCKDLKGESLVADEFLSSGYQKFLEKIKCSEGSGAELGRNLSSKSVLIQPELTNPAMSNIGARKRKTKVEALDSEKKSNFECTTCNKTFHSYQALGGHRASHKKAKGCSPSKPDGTHKAETEQITDISVPIHSNQAKDSSEGKSKRPVQMIHKHECPICFKEFPSGQALGGHKRSHLMATTTPLDIKFVSVERSNATTVTTTTSTTNTTTSSSHEVRDFLDLNLPAPVEEEASNGHHQHQQLELGGYKPWWVESTHKHEQIVGFISN